MQLISVGASDAKTAVYLTDDETDLLPQTGKTPTLQVSINGAALTTAGGEWDEVGDGVYTYQFTASEVGTVGFVCLRATDTDVRTFVKDVQVVNSTAVD